MIYKVTTNAHNKLAQLSKKLLPLFVIGTLSLQAVAQNPYPLVPIDSIQFVNPQKLGNGVSTPDYINPTFKNPVYKDTVQLEGYVTFNPSSYGLSTSKSRYGTFLQMEDGGPWSGVHVLLNRDIYPGDSVNGLDNVVKYFATFLPGTKVRATAIIGDFQGMTQMNLLKIKSVALPDPPITVTPEVLTIDQFMKNDGSGTQVQQHTTGEQWESVYIEFRDVTVVDVTPNGSERWFWSLQDAYGNRIRIQDISGYYRNDFSDRDPNTPQSPLFAPPPVGTTLSYVRGVITETTGNYNIAPLVISDLGPVTFSAPVIGQPWRVPVIATSSDSVHVFSKIKDDSAMATVKLYYAQGTSGGSFTEVPMDSIAGVNDADGKRLLTYKGTIPPFPDGTYVRYWIKATDNFGHSANFPDSLASGSIYRVVNNFNSIRLIQETPYAGGGSIWVNDTLNNIVIGGIVTSTVASNDLGLATIQSGNTPNSGIFVFARTGDGVDAWKRGDSILITSARVAEKAGAGFATYVKAGTTFLENLSGNHTVVSSGNTLPLPVKGLDIDSLIKAPPVTSMSEPWEGMLVEFDSVHVVNLNPDAPSVFGEFSIHPDSLKTAGLRVDDYSNDIGQEYGTDSLALGQELLFIRGVLGYAFGTWKLYPRNKADIDRTNNPDLEKPVITLTGNAVINIVVNSTYTDPGATAFDNKDGDLTDSIKVTGTVNTAIIGSYQQCYNVSDAAGNTAVPVCRTVNVGPNSTGDDLPVSKLNIFPVPAKNAVNIEFTLTNTDRVEITVTDISGKAWHISEGTFRAGQHTVTLDPSGFPAGVYLCRLQGSGASMMGRIVIIK
jgi:hypothetical protein